VSVVLSELHDARLEPARLGDAAQAARQHVLLHHALDVVLVYDAAGRLEFASPRAAEWSGVPVEELLGCTASEVGLRLGVDPADLVTLTGAGLADWEGKELPTQFRCRRPDGTTRWLEAILNNRRDDPDLRLLVVTLRDVTERYRNEALLAAENELLASLLQGDPIEQLLQRCCELVEAGVSEATAAIWLVGDEGDLELVPRSSGGEDEPWLPGRLLPPLTTEIQVREDGSTARWIRAVVDGEGDLLGMLVVSFARRVVPGPAETQVVELVARLASMAVRSHRSNSALSLAATRDALTGLPNRALFLDRVARALAFGSSRIAVLFVDLDRFKSVNDTCGHAAGDDVLQEAARRLQDSVRPDDTVARLGGDEFAVLCTGVDDHEQAIVLARRLLESLAAPFEVRQRTFHIGASIGIAVGGPGGRPETFLRDADAAMYRAKSDGGTRWALFTPEIRMQIVRRHSLESALRRALEQGEVNVEFQPMIALSTGRIVAVEALARWNSRHQGPVSPANFIPLAEQSGVITSLGSRVLDLAVGQLARWRRAGVVDAEFKMAVNTSVHELTDETFVARVQDCLARHRVRPQQLVLEVTESAVMTDAERAIAAVRELIATGIGFAIDDFGTGHSSLARLRDIDAFVLKLDRSFVAELQEPSGVELVAGVTALAHALNKFVVAEGVEQPSELEVLRGLGVDAVQGFHLARPAPADQLTQLLRSDPRW
jgi:diguanylate cyclase (GGDEF)-like protein/PAS domain S-box-containing protein